MTTPPETPKFRKAQPRRLSDAELVEPGKERLLNKLAAMVGRWKAEGARIDTFHATMAIGFKTCASELDALLAEED